MSQDEREINALVDKIQCSSDKEEISWCLEQIILKLKPLRFALAKKFANKGIEFDDIVQQIDLILIDSVYGYDKSKDPSALRHLASRTRNGIWNFYRKEMYYFDDSRRPISLDAEYSRKKPRVVTHSGLSTYKIAEYLVDEEYNEDKIIEKILIEKEFNKLTDHQQEVLLMHYIDDKTQYQVAEELDINQSNVSRAKKRAIKQLQDSINSLDD